MTTLQNYPIHELKLIYNLLHAQLPTHISLINSILLQDLQHYLLQQASNEGIDISSHADWAHWLTNGV